MTIPDMRTCFPRWHAHTLQSSELWAGPCNINNEEIFPRLFLFITDDQNRAQSISQDRFFALSAAITADLITLQRAAATPMQVLNLQYLQFETSIAPLNISIGNGGANIAYDWLMNGFSDCVSTATKREFLTGRIFDFRRTTIGWIADVRKVSLQNWFANLYYYARTWAALHSVANDVMPHALFSISKPWQNLAQTADTTVFMLNWCTIYNHEAEEVLVNLALELNRIPSLPECNKSRIAISFTTPAARFTSKQPEEWAKLALSNYSNHMRPQDRLQLLIASVTNIEDWDYHRGDSLQATDAYVAELQARLHSPTALAIATDQRVKILDYLIYKLHSYGRCDDLLAILCGWYAVPPQIRRRSKVLMVIPNHSEGMAYIGECSKLFPVAGLDSIEVLNEQTNNALGLALTLQGQTTQNDVATRPGTPEYTLGPTFEQTLKNHYQWASLTQKELEWARAMLFLPGYPHPVQALMQVETGRCLPITASLHEPLADRDIHRAAIWYSGEDNYSEMEAKAVAEILEAVGVTCIRMCGYEKTKDDFLNLYSDASLDLLWVAGHGECDRWDPSSPAILVGAGAQVFMDDLLALSASATGRRLLVLNICDSGAASVFGGIHKLGLAPMLAAGHQSIVGHSWPVDPIIAAGFGVKLAKELVSERRGFFAAYERALAALREPWPAFVEQIAEGLDTELIERLRNNERDLNNIFHWGSPCFFE